MTSNRTLYLALVAQLTTMRAVYYGAAPPRSQSVYDDPNIIARYAVHCGEFASALAAAIDLGAGWPDTLALVESWAEREGE